MQISNSTRQRSYFGVQSDRPGRSRVPDYYMSFAKTYFSFFLQQMQISKSTRQRSYFGVPSDRPGRGQMTDYYMSFEKNMFFTFFLKNANFKFHKTAQLFWRPKRPSRTQPSARLLYEFCKKHIFYIFSKK